MNSEGPSPRADFFSFFSLLPSVICHPSSVICHLSSVICHLPSAIRHLSSFIYPPDQLCGVAPISSDEITNHTSPTPRLLFVNVVELRPDPLSSTWWGFAPTRSLLLHLSCCLLADLLSIVFHICDLSSVICYLRLLSDLLCVVFHICDLSSVICYPSSVIYLRVKTCCVAPSTTSKKRK